MKIQKKIILVALIALLMNCAKKTEETVLPTIPDGTYLVSTLPATDSIPAHTLCTDNTRPLLSSGVTTSTNINQLVKFGELVSNSLTITIAGSTITKVWTRNSALSTVYPGANTAFPSGNTTCSVTWTGQIATNTEGIFQETGSFQVTWSPTNCEFEVHNYNTLGASAGVGAWIPNNYWSTMLVSTTSSVNQDAWEVTASGSTYTVKMPVAIAATQTQYTCGNGTNVVQMIWTKQP